ncbi:type II secretion system protein [Sulfurospirillum cavolei]|uniref:type II secretion system protein n=1 Tax=Sulfurospirillum cavolei TaxID=366522 RepID=UPI0007649E3C|nr:prepilin-type N-terminal cleavage/methylation domain-containing protein [Sulfurospirillum cavolei]
MKNAFTMIELVFVIVILGILAAVAIPRLAVTRDDAMIARGKAQVAAIRSGIAMQRSRNMLQGNAQANGFSPSNLDAIAAESNDGDNLFFTAAGNAANILEYPIISTAGSDGQWVKTGVNAYAFRVMGVAHPFAYNNATGAFTCTDGTDICTQLTQ